MRKRSTVVSSPQESVALKDLFATQRGKERAIPLDASASEKVRSVWIYAGDVSSSTPDQNTLPVHAPILEESLIQYSFAQFICPTFDDCKWHLYLYDDGDGSLRFNDFSALWAEKIVSLILNLLMLKFPSRIRPTKRKYFVYIVENVRFFLNGS